MSSILKLGNDKMDNNTGDTKKNYKVAVVTGSSSGIGFETFFATGKMASLRML
jgi:hypothetical protein